MTGTLYGLILCYQYEKLGLVPYTRYCMVVQKIQLTTGVSLFVEFFHQEMDEIDSLPYLSVYREEKTTPPEIYS